MRISRGCTSLYRESRPGHVSGHFWVELRHSVAKGAQRRGICVKGYRNRSKMAASSRGSKTAALLISESISKAQLREGSELIQVLQDHQDSHEFA